MSLSLVTPRLVSTACLRRVMLIRASSTAAKPAPAAHQLKVQDVGYFNYERDFSRDKRFTNPAKRGDTPLRFLTRKLGHAYELYPIFALTGIWFLLFCYTIYYSFEKIEIWLDRSNPVAPWDWERIRDNYWKKPTLVFDPEGVSRQRVPIMEQLQDEMVEAAKKRGTR